jgi:hypothetical protein
VTPMNDEQFCDSRLKSQLMEQTTEQMLFRDFAAPLAGYAATSPARKELAEMLVRNLWTALIGGPEMEAETWKSLTSQANLDADALQSIKQLYYEQMKPVVTEEQLVDLRQRYQLRRKE